MWPISYNNCSGSEKVPWSSLQPQRVTACEDRPPPAERARLGLLPGQGRGAPELDILEVSVAGGNTPERYTPPHLAQSLQARVYGSAAAALLCMTLVVSRVGSCWQLRTIIKPRLCPFAPQMGPVLPPGLNFADPEFYASRGLPQGFKLPGAGTSYGTKPTQWFGPLGQQGSAIPRAGTDFNDCMSAQSTLGGGWEGGRLAGWVGGWVGG